jgi:hypothetical protein
VAVLPPGDVVSVVEKVAAVGASQENTFEASGDAIEKEGLLSYAANRSAYDEGAGKEVVGSPKSKKKEEGELLEDEFPKEEAKVGSNISVVEGNARVLTAEGTDAAAVSVDRDGLSVARLLSSPFFAEERDSRVRLRGLLDVRPLPACLLDPASIAVLLPVAATGDALADGDEKVAAASLGFVDAFRPRLEVPSSCS